MSLSGGAKKGFENRLGDRLLVKEALDLDIVVIDI